MSPGRSRRCTGQTGRPCPHDRNTLAAVFPQRYSFVSESGNQTTFVASADRQRVGAYELRRNAVALRERFDFDLLGLAARYYMRTDWELEAEVLADAIAASTPSIVAAAGGVVSSVSAADIAANLDPKPAAGAKKKKS